jgi:hypothetical protein
MAKEHTFDDTLAELRRHEDSQRSRELYEVELFATSEHIREMITDDQLKAWMIIETLIDAGSIKSNPKLNLDHIRARLRGE